MGSDSPQARMTRAIHTGVRIAVLALATATLRGEEPKFSAPDKTLKKIESVAKDFAKAGRDDLAIEMVDLLRNLGGGSERSQALLKACNAETLKLKASKAKPKDKFPREAAATRDLAKDLATLIAEEPETQAVLARMVLALDPSVESAQKTLGRERVGSNWRLPGEAQRAERRIAIADAVTKSRALPLDREVTLEPTQDERAKEYLGDTASVARIGPITVYSTFDPNKLKRIVVSTARALTVANFLVRGALEIPKMPHQTFYWVAHRSEYDAALSVALKFDRVLARDKAHAKELHGFFLTDGSTVQFDLAEADAEATLLGYLLTSMPLNRNSDVTIADTQAVLFSGLHDWLCRSCLGTAAPRYAWFEGGKVNVGGDGTTRAESESERQLREELFRMAKGGIQGCRNYMMWRVQHHADPPFLSCLKDQAGKLEGDEPLKATLVVEYFTEQGDLLPILRGVAKTRVDDQGVDGEDQEKTPPGELFERQLGMPLDRFDQNWRDWLVPDPLGVVGRLEPQTAAPLAKGQKEALDYLNSIRQDALGGVQRKEPIAVGFDADLSAGCLKHAKYLLQHKEQAEKWPDAHEEYPDKSGFSVEGSFAGLHSVIAPGSRSAKDAIDGWMATFYHRLPLLEPNIVRIGFALEGGMAVLDASSLASPSDSTWEVHWPKDEARDVPLSFALEIPNPVPGEDESNWGYPITFQRSDREKVGVTEATFALHVGTEKGPLVEAHVSTPSKPTNPDLAPAESYCLIPKSRLKPNTKYFAHFIPPEGGPGTTWSFTTGK